MKNKTTIFDCSPPTSHIYRFHDVTSGFTRLSIETKYVGLGLCQNWPMSWPMPKVRMPKFITLRQFEQ